MNILTFDIEEWYLEKILHGGRLEKYKRYEQYLDRVLEKLDSRGCKGTFFCVGGMGIDFPHIVNKIVDAGHEIGCHSFKHVWLSEMTPEEVYEDTRMAVDALEQCIGKKVKSYRAPAFSIGKNNKYALDALCRCGIERDASIYPAERDFGGFAQFGQKTPTMVLYNQTRLKEFPICTTKLFGKELAYSGGGYFRFFPLGFIRKEMAKSDYSMTYFHLEDLIPESTKVMNRTEYEDYFKESGTWKNRYMRHLKSNLGKKGAFDKLMKLIEKESFVNMEQADKMIDWETVSLVEL